MLFVGIDRFSQVRVLRKSGDGSATRATQVREVTGETIANDLSLADGGRGDRPTWESVRARLHTIMPSVNEGFFADIAVLVEGEVDRAVIAGTARALGYELETHGISLLPCGGKANLHRALAILNRLGIPTFVIWDGDRGGTGSPPRENRRLLRMLGEPETDWPQTIVADRYACFEERLEATVSAELGSEEYEGLVGECVTDLGLARRSETTKNPSVWAAVMAAAHEKGLMPPTITAIVHRLLALACKPDAPITRDHVPGPRSAERLLVAAAPSQSSGPSLN